jgi:hypothetical protein
LRRIRKDNTAPTVESRPARPNRYRLVVSRFCDGRCFRFGSTNPGALLS